MLGSGSTYHPSLKPLVVGAAPPLPLVHGTSCRSHSCTVHIRASTAQQLAPLHAAAACGTGCGATAQLVSDRLTSGRYAAYPPTYLAALPARI